MDFESGYLIISVFVCFFVASYSWYQEARGSKYLAFSSFLAALWVIAEAIKKNFAFYDSQLSAEIMRFFAVILLPPSYYIFIHEYCRGRVKRKYLFYLVPSISLLVFFSNPFHSLFYEGFYFTETGFLRLNFSYYFWFIHVPYSFSLISASLAVSFLTFLRASRQDRKRLAVLFISTLFPFLASISSTLKFFGTSFMTAYAFPVAFLIIAYSIFRYKFLQTNPVIYETIFQVMTEGVVVLDKRNVVVDANPSFLKSVSMAKDEVVGKNAEEVFSKWGQYVGKYRKVDRAHDEIEVRMSGERRYFSLTIKPIETGDGFEGRILIFRDITYQKMHELSLKEMAYKDPLTQAANRYRLESEMKWLIEEKENFGLLYLDLNNFKRVNDSYGHETGDKLLKIIASRVSSALRETDLFARVGGDEFVVLVRNVSEVGKIKERISEVFFEPFEIEGKIFEVDCSIGFATYPKDGKDLIQLLNRADLRMFEDKRKRKMSLDEFVS
ncbi:MAG: diguanylate cyclase [Pyrinomonadaceae bacterium]|nr:diguanylate cyclase [Pyrinomonadaceae bacterium]MCX7639114.1 diguanylate cyclase [Pyrinomonadaceae bacterium]MDW8303665.1 diguanylate cyclase [Acidobacteriota bacterium]